MKARARNLVLAVVVFALWTTSASAAIIEIGLTAEVTEVDDAAGLLEGRINVGDLITGSYKYDSDTPDSNPLSTVADYVHTSAPYGIRLSSGALIFQTDPGNVDFLIEIHNNWRGEDGYLLRSYRNLPLDDGLTVDHISWQLNDYTGGALSTDDLPTTAPLLADWQYDWGLVVTCGFKGPSRINARVISVALVPEPITIMLLALGSLYLIRGRRW